MAREQKNGPERRCALSRQVLPTGRLVRFVADPAGTVVPDLKRSLPGRGVWIEAKRSAVADAVRRKVFARSLKRAVTVPTDIADQVAGLMRKRALSALSLANKAGAVVAGFQKVAEALDAGRVAVLVTAADGAEDGVRKLGHRAGADRTIRIDAFTSEELSLALGRSNVVHAAGLKSPAAEAFRAEACRLSHYLTDSDDRESQFGGHPAPGIVSHQEARPEAQ